MATLESPANVQSQFVQRVRACVEAWRLKPGTIVVGLSGGPDSVALLHGLLLACPGDGWSVAAAHLNHRLRGAEAERDERFVRELCAGLAVPLVVDVCDVAAKAADSKRGVEETARQARYAFFARVATQLGAAYLALGHTADDQAETVLHRVLRGTALAGLAGMPARRPLLDLGASPAARTPHDRGHSVLSTQYSVLGTQHASCNVELIRPLLEFSREQVLAFLSELGQPFVHDETNEQLQATRNRLRHDLLPKLAHEYNSKVREAIVRLARLAAETQQVVTSLADETLDAAIVHRAPHRCQLDTAALAPKHRHLIRECLVRLWQRQGWPLQAMSYEHWERLADTIVSDEPSGGDRRQAPSTQHPVPGTQSSVPSSPPVAVTFPGGIGVRRRGSVLVLAKHVG